jgi:hypothetical protein
MDGSCVRTVSLMLATLDRGPAGQIMSAAALGAVSLQVGLRLATCASR